MPPQAVTLEPMVQGERSVLTLRLLGRTEHAHQLKIATFLWYKLSAQGTGPLANTSEKFYLYDSRAVNPAAIVIRAAVRIACCYSNCLLLFELRTRTFGNPALLYQGLFNRLLQ